MNVIIFDIIRKGNVEGSESGTDLLQIRRKLELITRQGRCFSVPSHACFLERRPLCSGGRENESDSSEEERKKSIRCISEMQGCRCGGQNHSLVKQ